MYSLRSPPLDFDPAFQIDTPPRQTAALVFASPHSGNFYPEAFVRASKLDRLTLRRSEDAFVDELFAAAPSVGAPLIKALFPRAFVDPNREAYELDPAMFGEALPEFVNTASPRVAAGLGTIARVVASGAEIYFGKLSFAEARSRIEHLYRPYHAAIARLLDETKSRFGRVLLVDCHSMPSVGGPMDRDPGKRRVDFVLGDCHGASCAPRLVDQAERWLRARGYTTARNDPYAGGFCTRHYGRPGEGRHALQIEINRSLYMDETRIERSENFSRLAADMSALAGFLTDVTAREVAAP
ncbi:MAG TPA: N-formylglutamate amidohydrolase [Alphaproteobacteria bacterium]|nr:N-formylglutamate amidohydrolase [Alphaproteobacteria bacterium]